MDPEDPDDPDHSQNLNTSSCYHFGDILKILSKSVHKFLSYLVHKQTDGQANPGENITSLAEVNIKRIRFTFTLQELFDVAHYDNSTEEF